MWFDPQPKLAEITAQATSLVAASQVSQVSQAPVTRSYAPRVAVVAVVAAPLQPEPSRAASDAFPYGTACGLGDSPRTWTGRVVSRNEWPRMNEWEKHGPNGRHWNGITKQWEQPP